MDKILLKLQTESHISTLDLQTDSLTDPTVRIMLLKFVSSFKAFTLIPGLFKYI